MEDKGYVLYNLIDKNKANKVGEDFLKNACMMLFGFYSGKDTSFLMTDHNLRKQLLKNPRCVWNQGNMKSPIISKSTGHINLYLDEEIFKLKTDDKIINLFSKLYNTTVDNLALTSHEPCLLKPYKSMASHIYWNHDSNKTEYKGLLCCSKGSVIQLLPKVQKIKKIAYKYTNETKLKFIDLTDLSNFIYSSTQDSYLADLKWETIVMNPGDVLIYDTSLPFQTLANKNKEPFLAIPINISPKNYLDDTLSVKLWDQFQTYRYGDWLNNQHDNREEFQWRLSQNNFPTFHLSPQQLSLFNYYNIDRLTTNKNSFILSPPV